MLYLVLKGLPKWCEPKLEIKDIENVTIESIKESIIKTYDLLINSRLIRLQYKNENLDDSRMLKEYDIKNGDTIRYNLF
jgi:hypothetical protein